jgi:hypothetical protein
LELKLHRCGQLSELQHKQEDSMNGTSISGFRRVGLCLTVSLLPFISAIAAPMATTTTLAANPSVAFTANPTSQVVLTATVTASATGTVVFLDGAVPLSCAQGNPAALANGQASCSTAFPGEGIHTLTSQYGGDANFGPSSGTANVYIQNHATNQGGTYCNSGSISADGFSNTGFQHTIPYPSVIFVGDNVNSDITGTVSTASVTLKSFLALSSSGVHALLVAPDGTHAFDFFSGAGAGVTGGGDYTFTNGGPQLPAAAALIPGTWGPTAFTADTFTPGPPAPAPQLPANFLSAPPIGTSTFSAAFNGAVAHGAWKLFLFNNAGQPAVAGGGWCLNLTPTTGQQTTVTVNSSSERAALGASLTFTAAVTSNTGTVNRGTVAFTENGAPLAGAANGGLINVVNGVAAVSTTALPEGDHKVIATFTDATNAFGTGTGSVAVRVDRATSKPLLTGSVWSYCNAGQITIPAGSTAATNIGPATPNPSNIFVTNLPGVTNSVGLTLNGFHLNKPNVLESLLVGPLATTANTLDFFSLGGGANPFGPLDTAFLDGAPPVGQNTIPVTANGPASFGPTSYSSSSFFTLPANVQHAAPAGNFTFNTAPLTATSGGVFTGTNPNGTWSLYFNQTDHENGGGVNGGWCLNFTQNPVAVTPTAGHSGTGVNGNFTQGEQGALLKISVLNNGPGSTGDPDGNHPLTVTEVLAADFTAGTLPTGSPWNCTAQRQTVTCVSDAVIPSGSSYPVLSIPVNVSTTAAASATNQVSVSGGGATAVTSNTDTIVIDAVTGGGTKPVFTVLPTASPNTIFPPNGKLVDVKLDWSIAQPDAARCSLSVTSNEAITANDYTILSLHEVLLRAARNGNGQGGDEGGDNILRLRPNDKGDGNGKSGEGKEGGSDKSGRFYYLNVSCTNAGGTTDATATVQVLHDRGDDNDR